MCVGRAWSRPFLFMRECCELQKTHRRRRSAGAKIGAGAIKSPIHDSGHRLFYVYSARVRLAAEIA
jgi:hypothetical protein